MHLPAYSSRPYREQQPYQAEGNLPSRESACPNTDHPVGSFHYFWQLSGQRTSLALTQNLLPKPESPPRFPHTPLVLPVPEVSVPTHNPFPGFSAVKMSKCDYRMYNSIICFIFFN